MREIKILVCTILGAFGYNSPPPPYGAVGSHQCLTNHNNQDTYSMVKSYFDENLAMKYCQITPGCNIVIKIDRTNVWNFQGLKQIYEIGSTKTAPCQLTNHPRGTELEQVWPTVELGKILPITYSTHYI